MLKLTDRRFSGIFDYAHRPRSRHNYFDYMGIRNKRVSVWEMQDEFVNENEHCFPKNNDPFEVSKEYTVSYNCYAYLGRSSSARVQN